MYIYFEKSSIFQWKEISIFALYISRQALFANDV